MTARPQQPARNFPFNNGVPNQVIRRTSIISWPQRVRTSAFYAQDCGFWVVLRSRARCATTCLELFPRADDPEPALLPDREYVRVHGRSPRTTTSPAAAASRSTCSATARRRRSSTSAATSRRRRTAGSSSPTIPPTVSARRAHAPGPTTIATTLMDCDLLSQAAQSPTTMQGIDACGVGNANFGTAWSRRRSIPRCSPAGVCAPVTGSGAQRSSTK